MSHVLIEAKRLVAFAEQTRARRGDPTKIILATTRKGAQDGYRPSDKFTWGKESAPELNSLMPKITEAFEKKTFVQISVGWNSGFTHSLLLDFRASPPNNLTVIDGHTQKWHDESDPPYFKPFISAIAKTFGYETWVYLPVVPSLLRMAKALVKHEGLPEGCGECLKYTLLFLATHGFHR